MSNNAVDAVFSRIAPMTLLRVVTGLYYFPHVLSKIISFPGTVGFFAKAGFQPAAFFVIFSALMELCAGLCLVSGKFVKYAAIVSTGLLVVAAYAIVVVKGANWYWNAGGIEYLIFWALASVAVFLDAWRKDPGLLGFFKS
ncbi:MAG: DoxX family protein [Herbaspirillum sp.]|jgi:putative oxidoreductase